MRQNQRLRCPAFLDLSHRLGPEAQYVRSCAASEGTTAIPGFEGLTLDLDALWAETARLG